MILYVCGAVFSECDYEYDYEYMIYGVMNITLNVPYTSIWICFRCLKLKPYKKTSTRS